MKKKNGFTLIELLAVIIILGILMIIAIPSVTRYISDSRKNAYIDTAKEVIGSARNLVNAGKLEMYDTDATYYLDVKCVKTENAMKSPYGDFVDLGAFVVVTYDGKGYSYYWTSVDDAGQGVKGIVSYDKLDTDSIESDLTTEDIKTNRTLDGRKKVILITDRNHCQKEGAISENLEQVSSGGSNSGGSNSGGNSSTNYIFDGSNPPTTSYPTTPPEGMNVYIRLYADNSLAVCIKRNGTEHCFKSNNFDVEYEHVQEVFSDISCPKGSTEGTNDREVICTASDFGCNVYSDGAVICRDYSTDKVCRVFGNGSKNCTW